jgi:hypothetical protein
MKIPETSRIGRIIKIVSGRNKIIFVPPSVQIDVQADYQEEKGYDENAAYDEI